MSEITLRTTGDPIAHTNPFRFSTKYTDAESGFLNYGHRLYNPTTGSWLSKDSIEEDGGLNLYGFVLNNPINAYDILGMYVPGGALFNPSGTVEFKSAGIRFRANTPEEREETKNPRALVPNQPRSWPPSASSVSALQATS